MESDSDVSKGLVFGRVKAIIFLSTECQIKNMVLVNDRFVGRSAIKFIHVGVFLRGR